MATDTVQTEVIPSAFYSLQDAAKLIGVHRTTLYRWIPDNRILVLKIGRGQVVPGSEVIRKRAEQKPSA